MSFKLMVIVLTLALGAIACSDTQSRSATATPNPTLSSEQADSAVAAASMKTGDLPDGWSAQPSSSIALQLSPSCRILDQATFDGEIAHLQPPDFYGPDGEVFGSVIAAFSDGETAKETAKNFADAGARCADEFAAAFAQAFMDQDGGPAATVSSLSEVESVVLDVDQVRVLRLQFVVENSTTVVDMIPVARGRMFGVLLYSYANNLDESARDTMIVLFANKLNQGDSILVD